MVSQSAHLVGHLADGLPVFDRVDSHLHADAAPCVAQALAQIDLGGKGFVVRGVEFGRIIGVRLCVETNDDDAIVYARRPGRPGYSRCVRGRSPLPCAALTVILQRADDGQSATLVSAFVGYPTPREPFDPAATEDDVRYWQTHALIVDPAWTDVLTVGTWVQTPDGVGVVERHGIDDDGRAVWLVRSAHMRDFYHVQDIRSIGASE